MSELQNAFNIKGIVDNSSIKDSEKIYVTNLIYYLNEIKKNIRISVESSASATRLSLESYLHAKYPDLKDETPNNIIKKAYEDDLLNDFDYNTLQCLRLFMNSPQHIEIITKYHEKISQSAVVKIFAMFLSIIINDYSQYFVNFDEIVNMQNYAKYDRNTDTKYKWLFDVFIPQLSLKKDIDECIYDFPIGKYEIIKKYPADNDFNKKLIFEKYTYIVKEGNAAYYYAVPNIRSKDEGNREYNFDNIVRNKDDIYDLLIKANSIEFKRFNYSDTTASYSPHIRAYDLYIIKKNTVRLDDYLLTHFDQINKSFALLIVKNVAEILIKHKNAFSLRNLDEKSIFVTETNNGLKISVGSFKYVKIKDEWENECNSVTVGPSQIRKSKNNTDFFSAISINGNLLNDINDENYPEKMDVYSLIVLLAYILNMDIGINKPVTSNCFSDFSEKNMYKNSLLKSIKADFFDEIMSLEDFNKYLDEEMRIDANC